VPAIDPLAEREMLAQNGRVEELKKAARCFHSLDGGGV
jgi:hypothetical protein